WAQAGGFVLIAVFGVGLGVARSGRETLERLGLTQRFRPRWWLGMTLAGLAAGFAIDQLWSLASPETLENVETITDALFGGLIQTGLPGALTIGLSAGIGEELLFRGAAQPRFGILFTSLLFAAVHTQYSVSPALLQIFVVGILLGLTRQRAGTLTAIGVHASYNFVLALVSMCASDVLSCPW
ncbi:MAG: CPBP family intramembrane metalloprotease, partial [Chloroflexi bacterium]|nr:CPBP family intramembrane metalloprotease [Chloroflexota bacterium]